MPNGINAMNKERWNIGMMSIDELKQKLSSLAYSAGSETAFKELLAKQAPDICATIIYQGRMHMGMAMTHHHPGTISF